MVGSGWRVVRDDGIGEDSEMLSANGHEKRYLDVKEAAQYLGLAESTLYTMVSQQRIPFAKMGRRTKFDLEKLNKWVLTHTVEERQTIGP